MIRFLLLVFALGFAGCSSFYSSSKEEKFAAFSAHRGEWTLDTPPKKFGLSRSVQIIQKSKVKVGRNRLSYEGGLGMASLITTDGYAITAAHVIGDPPLDAFPALTDRAGTIVPTLHVHRNSFTITSDGNSMTVSSNRLVAFAPGSDTPRHVRVEDTEIRNIRVVKSFPERDIALIKLPLRTAACFELRTAPLGSDTVLFASGNWATPFQGTSAGTVTSIDTDHPAAIIVRSNAPLSKGDSGGPVFDAQGRLVGVASRVIPSQIFPYPKLRHSSLRQFDSRAVAALIEADRKAHR